MTIIKVRKKLYYCKYQASIHRKRLNLIQIELIIVITSFLGDPLKHHGFTSKSSTTRPAVW